MKPVLFNEVGIAMSIQFEKELNKEQQSMLHDFVKEIVAVDESQVLFNDLVIQQNKMKELANKLNQPVEVEVNVKGTIKTMLDGTCYQVTDKGWKRLD